MNLIKMPLHIVWNPSIDAILNNPAIIRVGIEPAFACHPSDRVNKLA